MDLNRNQFFLAGLLLLAIGFHFLKVESLVLNEQCSAIIEKKFGDKSKNSDSASSLWAAAGPSASKQKVIHPPKWLGWCLMSVGGVFAAQAVVMRKPGG
jgi:hypothetical protein